MLLISCWFASDYARTNGQAQPVVAFTHVNVIDGTGAALKRDQNVVTSSGQITAIGDADRTSLPPGSRVVDASGKYLIPGLWDAHVHSRPQGVDHLRLFIANGVTAYRDMGSPWEDFELIKQWRREIAAGERIGPRILTAGPLLDGPASQWWHAQIVSSPNEAREVVRRLRREGADFVKFYEHLSRETFFAIVDEAKQQGLPTAGHVPFVMSVREVAETGPRTIEHLRQILPACSSREEEFLAELRSVPPAQVLSVLSGWQPRLIDSFDRSKCLSVAAALRRTNTSVVPTLSNGRMALPELRQDAGILARFRYVPPVYHAQMIGPGGLTEGLAALIRKSVDVARVLHEAGVELLAGTDTPPAGSRHLAGFSLHDELSLLNAAGMSPMQVIEAATRKPARRFGKTDVGTIEAGMQADMVLLDRNPLDDIENTRGIAAVMTGGRLLDRKALDEMLTDIARKALEWNGTVRPGRPLTAQPTQSLQGVWRIVESSGGISGGRKNPQPGLFLFTAKHYALIRDTADKPRPPVKESHNPTAAEALATYQPFVAQAGSYEVSGDDTLVLRPSVMLNPPTDSNYNLAFTYTFKMDGNNLTVTQVGSNRRGKNPNPITMRWTRVE